MVVIEALCERLPRSSFPGKLETTGLMSSDQVDDDEIWR